MPTRTCAKTPGADIRITKYRAFYDGVSADRVKSGLIPRPKIRVDFTMSVFAAAVSVKTDADRSSRQAGEQGEQNDTDQGADKRDHDTEDTGQRIGVAVRLFAKTGCDRDDNAVVGQ